MKDEQVKVNLVKKTARAVILVVVLFLMLFPFINTLNQFLVNVIEPKIFIKPIQDLIIPYQVRLVQVVLGFLKVPFARGELGATSITLINKREEMVPIVVAWNCLGWQSLLVVGATFLSGLTGRFTFLSKLEVLVIGLLGTFLLNIGRLSTIFFLYSHASRKVAISFHDYGSTMITIIWVFVLWYYAFNFVLVKIKQE